MFFQNLSKHVNDTDLTISVRGGENQLTVSLVPKSTSSEKKNKTNPVLPVMTIIGTPKEIDEAFFNIIEAPIKKATDFLSKTAELEAASEKKKEEAKSKTNSSVKKTPGNSNVNQEAKNAAIEEKEEEELEVDKSQQSLF